MKQHNSKHFNIKKLYGLIKYICNFASSVALIRFSILSVFFTTLIAHHICKIALAFISSTN